MLVRTAQEWKPGAPIPAEFRTFKQSGGCFGEPTDTSQLLFDIDNLRFLVVLVFDAGVQDKVSEVALARALDLAGPARTFDLIRRSWPAQTSPRTPWLRHLNMRISKRHVVVDGLFIQESDMPAEEATRVLDRIEADLRSGAPWNQVYTAYSAEFGYATGDTTKVGNLGSFVVFDDPALRKPHRYVEIGGVIEYQGDELPAYLASLTWLPASHVQPILHARMNDILRLTDPGGDGFVLYQVREVYLGSATQ